jgi:hypothetical protein
MGEKGEGRMKIKSIFLWLVLMPTIIFIDVICFIMGIFSREIRRLYIQKFYRGTDPEMLIQENEGCMHQ